MHRGWGRGDFEERQRSFFPGLRPPRVVRCEEPPPTSFPDPLGSEDPEAAAASAAAAAAAAAEREPVHFEKFNREWQQMAEQDNFDGFRIEAAKQVTKWLQAAHTLFLGTQLRECGYIYQFGPAFQTEDQRTMLVARAGLDGAVNGRFIQKFGEGTELKGSSNSHLKEPARNMHEGSVEYTGENTTLAAKLAWQGAWLLGGAFTQRVVPSLHLGGDLVLVAVNGVTSIGQVGMRYAEGRDIFTATVSRTPDPKSQMGANLHEVGASSAGESGQFTTSAGDSTGAGGHGHLLDEDIHGIVCLPMLQGRSPWTWRPACIRRVRAKDAPDHAPCFSQCLPLAEPQASARISV
ncbi:unnamed protein product [Prorocentrum cordatum]|uniref:Uncharacterized protein n=1 Tax=Prorocentrum cordatum TaxID=2364126 RepID=A0ABN9WXQ7_9DINO|nr:unnamed protein product [Polarella glacialis]